MQHSYPKVAKTAFPSVGVANEFALCRLRRFDSIPDRLHYNRSGMLVQINAGALCARRVVLADSSHKCAIKRVDFDLLKRENRDTV